MTSSRVIAFTVMLGFPSAEGLAEAPATIDFGRDIQPLFKAHCIGCHGPKQQKNGFRLDRRRDAMKGCNSRAIAPGTSEASRLYLRLIGDRYGLQMPPEG